MQEINEFEDFSIEDSMEIDESLSSLFAPGGSPTTGETPQELPEEPEDSPRQKVKQPVTLQEAAPPPTVEDTPIFPEDEAQTPVEEQSEGTTEEVQEPSTEQNFQAIAEDFFKIGLLTTDDNEEETPITSQEELIERLQYEHQKNAYKYIYSEILSKHGQEGQKMFDAIFVKGVPPSQYLPAYNELQSFKNLDLTDESVQEQVVVEKLRRAGYSQQSITRNVNRMKEVGDLEDEAREAHELLLQQEEQQLQALEQQAVQQQEAYKQYKTQQQQTYVQVLNEAIQKKSLGDLPITKKAASELFDEVFTERYHLPTTGEKFTEFDHKLLELRKPENHQKKLILAYLWKMYEEDPTLSAIKKMGVSETADRLFSSVVTKSKQSTKKTAPVFGRGL